jgi:hypothetical protein
VAAARQLACGGGCDIRVKVGRVERQHVRRHLEAPDYGAGDLDLGLLQLFVGDLDGHPRRPKNKEAGRGVPQDRRDEAQSVIGQAASRKSASAQSDKRLKDETQSLQSTE